MTNTDRGVAPKKQVFQPLLVGPSSIDSTCCFLPLFRFFLKKNRSVAKHMWLSNFPIHDAKRQESSSKTLPLPTNIKRNSVSTSTSSTTAPTDLVQRLRSKIKRRLAGETLGRLTMIQRLVVPMAASFMTLLPGRGLGVAKQLIQWFQGTSLEIFFWFTRSPATNSQSTWEEGIPKRKGSSSNHPFFFQPSIFRFKLLVSGMVSSTRDHWEFCKQIGIFTLCSSQPATALIIPANRGGFAANFCVTQLYDDIHY